MHLKYVTLFLCAGLLVQIQSAVPLSAEMLSRQDAIRMALERNPEVIAARSEWEAARARVVQARALPDPELELEFEELPEATSLGSFGERNLGVTQRIEFPVKWWFRKKAAAQRADATRLSAFEMTKLEVKTRVKVAYDRVLLNQRKLDYIEQNLKLTLDFLRKSQVRFEAGDVAQLEVLRAEVEAGRAVNRVSVSQNDLSVSRAELNTLLARDIRAPLEVVGELSYRPVRVELERLNNLALERRPDLLGAGRNLESARAVQSTAVASIWPDLNLGVFRQTLQAPAGREGFWRVNFALELPLWAASRQRAEVAEAGAEAARVAAEGQAVRYRVLLEVESAFLDLKATGEQVRLFQDRIVREAERAYEVASESYREGKATYLELLEAQKSLTEIRVEYAEALFNYQLALGTLERAIGGDLSE